MIDQNTNNNNVKTKNTVAFPRPTTSSRRRQIGGQRQQPPTRLPNYYGAPATNQELMEINDCDESYLDNAYGGHKNSVLTAGLKDSLDS